MAECLVVEVVDADGKPCPPGEMGSILVTDLFNYAMPLIRYRVGDMGAIKAGECPCGRGLPMLERIEGRVTDFLVGKDGRLVSGVYVATYLIGKCPQLGRVQVLQETPGQLLFKVTGAASVDDTQFIVSTSKKMLGDDVEVEVEQVNEIPRTRSGKLVLCRSNATVDYLQTPDSAGVAE
jgi:phenylacetate-CoA ligase